MTEIIKCDASNRDFQTLIAQLDQYLAVMDGEEHGFYDQYNKLDSIKHVIVAYLDGIAVGCGAIKPFSNDATEIKRMYVAPQFRNRGIAQIILDNLENWAHELGYSLCILETGKRQLEAVKLYQKCGYLQIENFGPYQGVENSICMRKEI